MTSPDKDMVKHEIRRQQLKRRRRLVATFAGMVVLVAALALMLPALSMTADKATNDAGFFPQPGAQQGQLLAGGLDSKPTKTFTEELAGEDGTPAVIVTARVPEGALPEGARMRVAPVTDAQVIDAAKEAAEASSSIDAAASRVLAADVSFVDAEGNEVEPGKGVLVTFSAPEVSQIFNDTSLAVVHVDDELNAEALASAEVSLDAGAEEVAFEASAFSVYAVVYTVDFHWEVDGRSFECSIPGGGAVTLGQLIEAIGIRNVAGAEDGAAGGAAAEGAGAEGAEGASDGEAAAAGEATGEETDGASGDGTANGQGSAAQAAVPTAQGDAQVGEQARKLLAQVAKVEFSSPELVWVGRADKDTTVGNLKNANSLQVEPSAELTKQDLARIDAQAVAAGDWALISLKPFESEETLTVTMKNGEKFSIRVTDAQLRKTVITSEGNAYLVTVTYDGSAKIPDGSTLQVTEFAQDTEEYGRARNSVLADKKARDEQVDLSTFNLAALDISIIDPQGNEIEPAAEVQVDIQIKELPGVEDLNEIADTLQVQHHVEAKDGVVVETVFDGAVEGAFEMRTDSEVAQEGTVVDPNSVSEEDFAAPEAPAPEASSSAAAASGAAAADAADASQASAAAEDATIDASFQTPVFSTFTVTWSNDSSSQGYRMYLDGESFVLVNERHSAALVAENTNNGTRLKAVQYSASDDSITKWHFSRNGYTWYFNISDGNGHYLNIGDGNNSYVRVSDQPQWIYIDGNNGLFRLQRSESSYSTAVNLYGGSINGGFGPYNDRGENEWFRAYYPSAGNEATIHYVDEDGNDLTVSKGSISSSSLLKNYAYLIYDIEGGEYEYKETYIRRGSENTNICSYLRWSGSRWQYSSDGGYWNDVNDNDDIYVVYKKKATVQEGGTPTLVELSEDKKPEAPAVTKDSKVNGDGTNTLSLSVTSHTTPREVLKLADVIVIFDRSGSMGKEIGSDNDADTTSKQRMALLRKAVNDLAEDLIGDNSAYIYTDKNGVKHKQIEMSLVDFSTTATAATSFTDDASTFKKWVSNLTPDGGTNWEQALQKANEAAVDSGRATFVIFVTDGEPTFRMARLTDADSSLSDDIYFPNNSTNYGTYYRDNNVYGTGYSDDHGRNYSAALAQAKSIVAHNKNLYMIGVGPDVKNLEQFNADAGAGGYYSAESSTALTNAFEDIKKKIAALAGYGDFQIHDGITDLTQTVQKAELVGFVEDDFTYYKGKVDHEATKEDVDAGRAKKVGDPVVLSWDNWDPASENCEKAKYENGAVVWNMGPGFMPQDGYTYQVRFKVWPSQEAYDLLADLNNGKKTYAELTQAEREQISEPETPGGIYTLKTNSDTSYNYKEATTVDGAVTTNGENLLKPAGTFQDVDPLQLTTRPLKVQKRWYKNYVDNRALEKTITLELYGTDDANRVFRELTLSEDNQWNDDSNFVSYGLMTLDKDNPAGTVKIYETGHDFTLRETGENAHYYELSSSFHRPMVINGTSTILERVDSAPSGMAGNAVYFKDGNNEYYRLDGKVYRDTKADVLLLATNSHRSFMDLTKAVVDKDGAAVTDGSEFEYQICFTVPEGAYNFDSMEKYIWFSVYDPVAKRTLSPSEYVHTGAQLPGDVDSAYSGDAYSNYLVAESGQQFTLKIKPGWNVRFLNLMNGTKYEFKEVNISEGYTFNGAAVSGTRWEATFDSDGKEQGDEVTMANLPVNNGTDPKNTTIIGTIDWANARYKTTYTNMAKTKQIKIRKTDQDSATALSGAGFDLYAESGYNSNPRVVLRRGLQSDENGFVDLGKLTYGKYYLVETVAPAGYNLPAEPVVITVSDSGVTHSQPGNSSSQGQQSSVKYDSETGVYTLTVTNNAGHELPITGGIGTTVFTVVGLLLIVGAIALLVRRKR